MAYTIMSGDKVTVAQVDAVAAIAEGAHHASTGETVIADSDGALVATIRRGADLSSPGGLVAVLADGTRVDLSETESPRAARELIRAAM